MALCEADRPFSHATKWPLAGGRPLLLRGRALAEVGGHM